jgi:MerR family copper efflux transcriptional regulator
MGSLIGAAAKQLDLSHDTLRYYEKIGLVPRAPKNASGRRVYSDTDVARLKFVQRAQGVGFTLGEISQLLKLRESPVRSSRKVRELAAKKREAMHEQLVAIQKMHDELSHLLTLCDGRGSCCPILENLDRD